MHIVHLLVELQMIEMHGAGVKKIKNHFYHILLNFVFCICNFLFDNYLFLSHLFCATKLRCRRYAHINEI